MRTIAILAVALMLVVAGCSQAPGTSTTTADTTAESEATTASGSGADETTDDARQVVKPDDPDEDVLGWEDGVWHNETIAVNPENGLNDTELNRTVSRAMARVEQIRGLEFDERVPVEIVTRDEFRENRTDRSTPADRRLFDNAKFEALFMITESTDSLAVQNQNSGSAVGGFYDPTQERIVVVSENTSTPKLNEITLSQELFHALQDQQFNISSFNQSTRELHNARDGVIEGDGNYVDHLYSQRCQNEWDGDCLMPTGQSEAGGELANIGPYLVKFQPYSDGPAFVEQVRDDGGWEAVDALYEEPPASTEQVIHPDKYGEDEPAEFSVADRSADEWERLTFENRPNYASVGEAGIFTMFMYPYYDSEGQTQIVPARQFFNMNEDGELREFDPLNYNSSYSDGWDGDKLVVYASDETPRNETAYVWKTVWDSERDAAEFVEGYEQLLDYWGAEEVEGHENTWRISRDGEFDDAYYARQDGDTVVIVNAPSVEQLPDVRDGTAPET
ncbi:hypothetical protein BRC82_07945 [Halobacteriales archaeon QS_1_67_19]|nr:MAG: hypothetical protein BRC82_07945 [Halobacteriales archaeon QS_1_67_19]